jgi:hypothetical protein
MKAENPGSDWNPNQPASRCPGCGLPLEDWPERGAACSNPEYCCDDCAGGIKCSCADKHLGAVSA